MTDADAVAQWMIDRIQEAGDAGAEQGRLVRALIEEFGDDAVRYDESGRPAVARRVLTRFRALHKGRIHWDRDRFAWTWVGDEGVADGEPADDEPAASSAEDAAESDD
jgi:hypothetical protein